MGDLLDKAQAKLDEMENKSHDLKGQAKQKQKDLKNQKESNDAYYGS